MDKIKKIKIIDQHGHLSEPVGVAVQDTDVYMSHDQPHTLKECIGQISHDKGPIGTQLKGINNLLENASLYDEVFIGPEAPAALPVDAIDSYLAGREKQEYPKYWIQTWDGTDDAKLWYSVVTDAGLEWRAVLEPLTMEDLEAIFNGDVEGFADKFSILQAELKDRLEQLALYYRNQIANSLGMTEISNEEIDVILNGGYLVDDENNCECPCSCQSDKKPLPKALKPTIEALFDRYEITNSLLWADTVNYIAPDSNKPAAPADGCTTASQEQIESIFNGQYPTTTDFAVQGDTLIWSPDSKDNVAYDSTEQVLMTTSGNAKYNIVGNQVKFYQDNK